MANKKFDVSKLIEAVASNHSAASTIRALGLIPAGGNYATLYTHIKQNNLDTTHWTGQGHLKGKHHNWTPSRPFEEILIKDSTYSVTSHLRKRLIKANLLKNICYECGQLPEWNNKPLVLQLDHINGIRDDNRLENLRILCGHCHSQTITFAGKNIKPKIKNINKCINCNLIIWKTSKRCKSCAAKIRNQK